MTSSHNASEQAALLTENATLKTLLSISDAIARVKNREELLELINSRLKSLFTFSHSVVLRLHNKGQYLTTYILDPLSKNRLHPAYESIARQPFPTHDSLLSVSLHAEGPTVFDIEEEASKPITEPYLMMFYEMGFKEFMTVPLHAPTGIPLGMLIFLNENKNSWDTDTLRLIGNISVHISTAMSNITFLEDIRLKDTENEMLLSVSTAISSIKDKQEMIQSIHTILKRYLHFSDITLTIFDVTRGIYKPYLFHCEKCIVEADYDFVTSQEYPLYDGLHDWALVSEKVNVVTVASMLPQHLPNIDFIHRAGIKELACVRLQNSSEILGAMVLLADCENAFTEAHKEFMQRLSHHMSTMVSNLIATEANIQANARIEQQLQQINNYKEQLEKENSYLQQEVNTNYSYSSIIGTGSAMQEVFNLLSQVSFANSTVLILGETGTGKELVARALHHSSSRKDNLMVKVNCAALPPSLIESELFGHERGSFTGALERRIGKFELANRGTLFLDEIGEMPLDLQVKLLRALQEKEIERVGGKETIKIDVRIIAATNRDLEKEVDEGRFRKDLYYRLNVFPIMLPALRDHSEDIPTLAMYFVAKFAKNNGKKINKISGEVLKELCAYDWPGNVRELEHMMERSVLMAKDTVINEVHLPQRKNNAGIQVSNHTYKTLEQNERDHIVDALKRCKGKVSGIGGAAELLDIKVTTLNSIIKRLGIKKETAKFS